MTNRTQEERDTLSVLGYEIMLYWFGIESHYDYLRKVFLKSTLTPQDVVFETKRKRRCLTGDMNTAVYEYIQYAIYREMRNNPNSQVIDTIYELAKEYYSKLPEVPDYPRTVRCVTSDSAGVIDYGDNVNSFIYFFLVYEKIPMKPLQMKAVQAQVRRRVRAQMFDQDEPKGTILKFFTFEQGQSMERSEEYLSLFAEVTSRLVDYLKVRYNTDSISEDNWTEFVDESIHMGLHSDDNGDISVDSLACHDAAIFQGICTLACEDYHFSYDSLTTIMGDLTRGRLQGLNYHPNVADLYVTAFQALVESYCREHPGECTIRKNFAEELLPFMSQNIEVLYNNLVHLYYIDCIYKVLEKNRDEYYYNFPWFYDIEKVDETVEAPVLTLLPQGIEAEKTDAEYTQMNARYERERKRVLEVGQRLSHELAEKDRQIEEKQGEIDELKKQVQMQQEYLDLISRAEDPTIPDEMEISTLFGKRFLFVGQLLESYAELKRSFPNSIFMESETVNIKSLKVDAVVLLIRNMSHSMYYKVIQNGQLAGKPRIYCNSRNINNVYQAMLEGLGE